MKRWLAFLCVFAVLIGMICPVSAERLQEQESYEFSESIENVTSEETNQHGEMDTIIQADVTTGSAVTVTESAISVAAAIKSINSPAAGDAQLAFPSVPEGYSISLYYSSDEGIISLSGQISPSKKDQNVNLIFEITKTDTQEKAFTTAFRVKVPKLILGRNYYIDAETGNDESDALTPETAWKSLANANRTTFSPGDKILLKAGTVYNNQYLMPMGSGSEFAPIIIDMYTVNNNGDILIGEGIGKKPAIHCNDTNQIDGYRAALYLYKQEYWEISNLEITNKHGDKPFVVGQTGNSDRATYLAGVYVGGYNCGTIDHIYLRNLEVHNVNGVSDGNKTTYGILVTGGGGERDTKLNDVLIENCYVHDVARSGIRVTGSAPVAGYHGYYPDAIVNRLFNTNVVVRNNYLQNIGGDGIVVTFAKAAVVESNVCDKTSLDVKVDNKQATAGIWSFYSKDVVFQYNEVFLTSKNIDGEGYDSDWSMGSVFQYNYSHDNGGGFMLICLEEVIDTVIRYNISQNDNFAVIVASNVDEAKVYNNTFYLGGKTKTTDVIMSTQQEHTNVLFENNIFYNAGGARTKPLWTGLGADSIVKYDNNAYFGFPNAPADANGIYEDPRMVDPGKGGTATIVLDENHDYTMYPQNSNLDGYKLKADSPLIGAGKVIENNGGRDYYGNMLADGKPDIGAFEYYENPGISISSNSVKLNGIGDKAYVKIHARTDALSSSVTVESMNPEIVSVKNEAGVLNITAVSKGTAIVKVINPQDSSDTEEITVEVAALKPDAIINDNNARIKYTGDFGYDNDIHFSNVKDASAEVTFVGTGIDLISTVNRNSSDKVEISVDGNPSGLLNLKVPNAQYPVEADKVCVYSVSGLNYGTHTLKVQQSGVGTINIDEFRVYDSIQGFALLVNTLAEAKTYEEIAYTLESYGALQTAISTAESVLNSIPGQEQCAEEAGRLQSAIDGLVLKVDIDKTPLLNKIAEAKAISGTNYTADSYSKLQEAVTAAEEVLNTITTQEKVAEEVAKLQSAIDGLVKKNIDPPVSPTQPTPDPTPVITVDKGIITIQANGEKAYNISSSDLYSAADSAKDGIVVLAVKNGDKSSIKINIAAQDIALLNKKADSLVISTGIAKIHIDTEALMGQIGSNAKKLEVYISAAGKVDSGNNIYEIALSVDNKNLNNLKNVTLDLPYTHKSNEKSHMVVVSYINSDGETSVIKSSRYDAEEGSIAINAKSNGKYAVSYSEIKFNDVAQIGWAKTAIETLAARGVVSGYTNNEFRPNDNITRAQFINMLLNAFEMVETNIDSTFTDAKKGSWYFNALSTAQMLGIVSGKADGTFGINDEISRQDMAAIAYRVAKLKNIKFEDKVPGENFTDRNDIAGYALEAIQQMQKSDIMSGMAEGRFVPEGKSTRAQAAVVIWKLFIHAG